MKTSKQKAYALVLVLAMLLISSIAGSFFLKRGDQRLEISQLNLNERSLRIKIASDFNRLSQEFSLFIEQRLSAANAGDPKDLLDDYLCQTDNPTAPCFDVSDFLAEGIQSVIVRCRGQNEGTDFQSRTCLDDQVFPKTFFMEVQIRSLEKRDVSLLASGEIMFAPTPLNTFAQAASAISSPTGVVNSEYDGNVAYSFCSPDATIIMRPSANKILSFSKPIVTNDLNKLEFNTSAPGAKINYPGVKELPGLGGMLSAFEVGMNRAMGEEANRVFDVREELLDPGINFPDNLRINCLTEDGAVNEQVVEYRRTAGCVFASSSNFRFWLDDNQFYVEADRECSGSVALEALCNDISFPEGDNSLENQLVGLGGWIDESEAIQCFQSPFERDMPRTLDCGFFFMRDDWVSENIGTGPNESNIFVFSQMPEVIFDQVGDYSPKATANIAFAIYVPDGRVNLMRPFEWTGNDNRLGGSFFARDGFFLSRDTNGDNGSQLAPNSNFTFDATLVALGGPDYSNPEEWTVEEWTPTGSTPTGSFPSEPPTGDPETSLVRAMAAGSVDDTDIFSPAKISFCEGEHFRWEPTASRWVKIRRPAALDLTNLLSATPSEVKLGTISLKGGLISPELSWFRWVNSSGVIKRGFQDVESVFLPNDSPPLIQRVFVSDLMTTVLNLNIHISDPRAAMDEVGLTWEEL